MVSAASYLAVWAGVYVTGGVLYVAQVAGLWGAWDRCHAAVLAYAVLAGTGVSLLDRVKLRDAWLDPADKAAHPGRFGFLERWSARVRILAAVLLTGSVALGWWVSPLLGAVT